MNNPDISLTIIDDDKNISYISHNISSIRAKIVKLKNNRYATIKPVIYKINPKCSKITHKEISDIIKQKIIQ